MAHPHDPYITAVIDALTAADVEPDRWWTSDAESDPYYEGDDAGPTMLSAVLRWDGGEGEDGAPEDGLLLLWEHPAEQWQYAALHLDGSNAQPEFLAHLDRYVDPTAVATVVRALLAGEEPPAGPHPEWAGADQVRTAVTAWSQS